MEANFSPRDILLDTETTGVKNTDRIIEIGCVELVNGARTGNDFHQYINPERPIPPEATAVHHITDAMIANSPKFSSIAPAFLEYIAGARLIIHNARFDIGKLNYELSLLGLPPIQNEVLDTMILSRKLEPGKPASLDAIMARRGISGKERKEKGHGALLDAALLAQVWIHMCGGSNRSFDLRTEAKKLNLNLTFKRPENRTPLFVTNTEEEIERHTNFVSKIKGNLWVNYQENTVSASPGM